MQDFSEIDLKQLLLALIHKAWLLVLCALIAGGIAYVYTANFITPLYRASVSIYVNNASPQAGNGSYISGSDLATAQRLVNTYVNIIRSNTVLEKVAQGAARLAGSPVQVEVKVGQAPPEGCTCEALAEWTGLSSVTVRRYLTYLVGRGEASSRMNYDTGGRPSLLYALLPSSAQS